MMFDWAAQPFFTVVITFVFGPYFAARMATDPAAGQLAWSNVGTISSIIIAILSPILGSVADETGNRKHWIGFFATIKIVSLSALWYAAPGSSLLAIGMLIVLASIAAEFSIVFNDSMMTRLVSRESVGKISNIAWGLGYAGGLIALFFVLLFLAGSPTTGKTIIGITPLFGLDPATGEDARVTGPLAAVWYLIFILPMFFFTPDSSKHVPIGTATRSGLRQLGNTLKDLVSQTGLMRFFVSRMLYQDGVNALLFLGGAYAAGMFGWQTTEIGLFGIILAFVAIFSCVIAGYLDNILGSKVVVVIGLVMLIAATTGIISTGLDFTLFGLLPLAPGDSGGLFGTAAEKAYILYGVLIGLAFGPVQASSRSYLARSVSSEEAGRYFGIYALSGRATSFLATAINSGLIWLTASPRIGMSSLIGFFVIGLILLLLTPYPADRGEQQ
ncbi:MFS transporter [Rhizobium sp. KVB221]|uniref:MFS transporter n=1 Tax=Rhizobium setariae TaxID=2801340 RepID=A0A936YP76_9HYPH|nr:MFS transporter [Rhizobium setariae]MBL0374128.1 MFS transporter [Rhizobium setariae]